MDEIAPNPCWECFKRKLSEPSITETIYGIDLSNCCDSWEDRGLNWFDDPKNRRPEYEQYQVKPPIVPNMDPEKAFHSPPQAPTMEPSKDSYPRLNAYSSGQLLSRGLSGTALPIPRKTAVPAYPSHYFKQAMAAHSYQAQLPPPSSTAKPRPSTRVSIAAFQLDVVQHALRPGVDEKRTLSPALSRLFDTSKTALEFRRRLAEVANAQTREDMEELWRLMGNAMEDVFFDSSIADKATASKKRGHSESTSAQFAKRARRHDEVDGLKRRCLWQAREEVVLERLGEACRCVFEEGTEYECGAQICVRGKEVVDRQQRMSRQANQAWVNGVLRSLATLDQAWS